MDKLYLCHLPRGEEAKSQILREAKMVFGESFIPEVLGEIAVSGWEGRVRTNLQRFVTNTDNDAIVKG